MADNLAPTNSNHKVKLSKIRELILKQFSFLNTLSIQIQNDVENINSYHEEVDEILNHDPRDENYIEFSEYTIWRHEDEELRSLYFRSKLVLEQLQNLLTFCKEIDLPDGKLLMHLNIAIKTATTATSKLKSKLPSTNNYY